MPQPAKRFDLLVTLGCLALLGYFAWHAWKGPRGYPYLDELTARTEALADELQQASSARVKLESRVALLRPESIDPDFLDQLAREVLDMRAANELVVHFSE